VTRQYKLFIQDIRGAMRMFNKGALKAPNIPQSRYKDAKRLIKGSQRAEIMGCELSPW